MPSAAPATRRPSALAETATLLPAVWNTTGFATASHVVACDAMSVLAMLPDTVDARLLVAVSGVMYASH